MIKSPDKVEKGYRGRLIAQKGLDEKHVLRVVYEDKPDYIAIITIEAKRIDIPMGNDKFFISKNHCRNFGMKYSAIRQV